MINLQLSKEFYEFLVGYTDFYSDLLSVQKQKYEVIKNNDIAALDEIVKQEQVYTLKSKGLEHKREEYMKQCDGENATFKELLPQFSPIYNKRFIELFDKLSDIVFRLKDVNVSCNMLTETRLKKIAINLNKLQNNSQNKENYNKDATVKKTSNNNERPVFISKKV